MQRLRPLGHSVWYYLSDTICLVEYSHPTMPDVGVEPTATRLKVARSTTELTGQTSRTQFKSLRSTIYHTGRRTQTVIFSLYCELLFHLNYPKVWGYSGN